MALNTSDETFCFNTRTAMAARSNIGPEEGHSRLKLILMLRQRNLNENRCAQ